LNPGVSLMKGVIKLIVYGVKLLISP